MDRYEVKDVKSVISSTSILAVYERLISGTPRGQRTSRGLTVRCPLPDHADDTPSCSLTDDGGPRYNCFGCGEHGGLLDFIVKTGLARSSVEAVDWIIDQRLPGVRYELSQRNYLPRAPFTAGHDKEALARAVVTARYDYPDAGGEVLYRVVRTDGIRKAKLAKDFTQYHPDPSCNDPRRYGTEGSGWARGSGSLRVPYRLPELLAAARRGETVWLVEGEKCVEALRSLGVAATTAANGSSWAMGDDWAQYFAGAKVLIVPDCDAPGRRCATARYSMLRQHGIQSDLLELDATRNDHYDVADLIAERIGIPEDYVYTGLRTLYHARTRAPIDIDEIAARSGTSIAAAGEVALNHLRTLYREQRTLRVCPPTALSVAATA